MRNITQHRTDLGGGFDETVQGLVKNAPWWLISAAVHGIALLIFWNMPIDPRASDRGRVLQAQIPQELETPDEPPVDPPPPEVPPDDIEETPTTIEEDVAPEEDTDNPDIQEEEGLEGDHSGPFDMANDMSKWIGLGPGAAGGSGRGGSGRKAGGEGRGGLTRNAVELGLKWLADHQDVETDGRWDCDNFMKHDPADDRCDGPGGALHDVGVTGLSVLAFLGAGYTDRGARGDNKFARNVRRGLRFLRSVQDEDGLFGTRAHHAFIYDHAIATLAMCEAYWMTRNPGYKKPAQDGLNFLSAARNPYMAWRYRPRGGENDTSVTGWCVMALKSGKFAGLEVDPDAFDGARLWIDKMTDVRFGQVGYDYPGGAPSRPEGRQDRFPPEKSQSMTAVGILTRIFLGEDPRTSEQVQRGAQLCLDALPVWNPDDGSIDMYYWYYATLALFQVSGTPWRKWNKAMSNAIVTSQHPKDTGRRTGSWDPIGVWGDDGGRVYATATMVMCLEVYYRYDRVFGAK